ncbi:MAG: YceI family protein [Pseudomonadota bacterium]
MVSKQIRRSFGALALLAALVAQPVSADNHAAFSVPTGTYKLEPTHGYIVFSYSHLGFSKPHLRFDSFDVTLNANSEQPDASTLAVTVAAASINSQVEEFDEHLNGEDYFDSTKYPEISFSSTKVTRSGDDTFEVVGDLTIKDVTKPVTLEATINKAANHPMRGKPTIGVSANGLIKRSEWGLGKYVPNVGDEVSMDIQVELIQE